MTEPARRRGEREAVLRRIFELSRSDQLHVFGVLREYLAANVEPEPPLDAEVRRQEEALAALVDAATELKLSDGQAMTTAQYRDAEVAARVSVSRIVRAFGSWRQGQATLTGGWVREAPAQRSLRLAIRGRRRTHEEYLDGVREWLASEPAGTRQEDYSHWAKSRNQRLSPDQLPVVSGYGVRVGLALDWGEILDVARGHATLTTKRQERAARLLPVNAADHELIGSSAVALVTGRRITSLDDIRDPAFPVPVALVGTQNAWVIGDVRAYLAGEQIPNRTMYEKQEEVLAVEGIASRLGVSPPTVYTHVELGHTWRCPPPAGHVGTAQYWWRSDVDAWFAAGNPQDRRRRQARNPA